MMGRQINGTSEGVPGSLWKQGSLNLPAPEESGFPATHPDMCILRIRRNHLLEVGRRKEEQAAGWAGGWLQNGSSRPAFGGLPVEGHRPQTMHRCSGKLVGRCL